MAAARARVFQRQRCTPPIQHSDACLIRKTDLLLSETLHAWDVGNSVGCKLLDCIVCVLSGFGRSLFFLD